MSRKMKKLWLFIALFFIGTMQPMAREVNFKELNAAVEEKGATWYYVVGEYVFTSTYGQGDNTKLSIQDFMLGARSVGDAEGAIRGEAIYDAMTINYVKKEGNEWKIQNNYLGKTDLNQSLSATDDNKKINIKYIDYEILKTPTQAKIDLGYGDSNKDAYQRLIEETYGFTNGNTANSENLKLESTGSNQYNLTGLLKKFDGNLNNVFQGDDLTKYYFSYYVDFENKDLVTNDSTITIKVLNQQGNEKTTSTKTFTKNTFDSDTGIAMLFAYKSASEYQKLEITLDYDGQKEIYAPTTYTIDLSKLTTQKNTIMNDVDVKATIPEGNDKTHFEDVYGYNFMDDLTVTREDNVFKISGDVHEQVIKDGIFTGDEVTNFYIPYNINPTSVIIGKTTVTRPIKHGTENPTTIINDEYGLSVLLSIQPSKIENCKQEAKNCQFEFTVDLDGSEDLYIPAKFTLDYSGINLIKHITATFNYREPEQNKVLKLYPGETIKKELVDDPTYDEYHEFTKWTDTKNELFEFDKTVVNEDITLNPNWTILVSKYINAKVNGIEGDENYDKPTIDGTNITLNIKKNDLSKEKLSELLSPIIAEALKTNEFEKITLKLDDKTADITSSDDDAIKTAIENTLLTEKTDLDELITKTITISFEKKGDALVEFDEKKDYSLTFTADFRVIQNETELNEALAAKEVNTIYVTKALNVNKEYQVSRKVTISGTDDNNTITGNGESIFKVTGGEVTFKNIKLTGAKVGILATAGTVNLDTVDLSNNTEAGIELNGKVTLKGDKSKITYSNESYEKPLVRIPKEQKNNHKIEVTDLTKVETLYDVKKFDKNSGYDAEKDIYIGDTLVAKNYSYINHYLDASKSNKWLKLVYNGDRSITNKPVIYTIYFDKEKGKDTDGNNAEPAKDIKYLTTYDGSLGTYTVDKWANSGATYDYGTVNPTQDGSYGIIYKVDYKQGTVQVEDEESLIEAVKADSNNKIVIIKNEITLTKELDITASDITITGKVSGVNEVNGALKGKIKVSGDNVRFSLMSITGNTIANSETKSVVTIEGTGFNSSQVNYKANNIGSNWDNILCYTHTNPTTVLFYNVFDGSNATSLIDFKGQLSKDLIGDKHSRLIGNDFKGASETKEFIIIESFENGAKLDITQTEADFVGEHEYGIRIKKPTDKINATIDLGYDWFNSSDKILKIALEADENTDYSDLTITGGRNFKDKVKLYYLNGEQEAEHNEAGEVNLVIKE